MEDNRVRGYVLRTLEEYPNIVRRIAIFREAIAIVETAEIFLIRRFILL